MSSSTICSRLHGIFKNSSPTKTPVLSTAFKNKGSRKPKSKPITKIIPKSESETLTKPKPKFKSGSKPGKSDLSKKDQTVKFLVKKFKNSCKSSQFRRKRYEYETIGAKLISAGKRDEIEEIVEYQKQFTEDMSQEKFVVRLLSMYGKAGMFDHAQKLFNEMPELKCERTSLSFNALLSACVNAKKYDKISELILELPKKLGVELNIVSYNIVVNAFSEMGDMNSASLVIEEMENNGIEADLITYNTLLEGLYKSKKFKEADKVWTVMELKNVSPTVRTYNAKIRGLISDDRMSEVAELIKEMVNKSVKPDVYTYNELIRGAVKGDNILEASKWYKELAINAIKPAQVTFKILLPFAIEKLDFNLGLELCKDAMKQKVTLNVVMVQKIVNGLVKESMVDEAEELVKLGKAYTHYSYHLKMPVKAE